jgi:hypothetical protein
VLLAHSGPPPLRLPGKHSQLIAIHEEFVFLYAIGGLLVGVLFALAGFILLIHGVADSTSWTLSIIFAVGGLFAILINARKIINGVIAHALRKQKRKR